MTDMKRSKKTSRLADCMQGERKTSGGQDFATMKSVELEIRWRDKAREGGIRGKVKRRSWT